MKLIKNTIKYMCIVVAFAMVVIYVQDVMIRQGEVNDTSYAKEDDDKILRVGLEGLYYNKASINMKNVSLVIGYFSGNSYVKETTIAGGGFTFKPYTESFSLNGDYSTYEDAKVAANAIKAEGKEAYPVLRYLSTWSVAVKGEGSSDKYAVMISSASGEKLIYTVDSHNAYPQFSAAKPNKNGVYVVDLGERQYRGRIELGRYGGAGSLKVVSIVGLEEYLYGVVPCEMVSSWHMEALKTQAVCARSYAYLAGFGAASNISKPYNMCDTTSSQVYKGYGAERKTTNEAVDATKGKIIYYEGKPARAYYSSTSGGSTENVEDVWGSPKGYLRQVSDIYELDPELDPWIKELSADKIENLMRENGVKVGNIKDVRPFVMTASGRVYSVEIVGDSSQVITGSKLRKIFSLYSTKYKVIKYGDKPDYVAVLTSNGKSAVTISDSYILSGDYEVKKASKDIEQFVTITADNLINYPAKAPTDKDTYYIAGMGYGHGIGMSQSGAKGMAEAGFSYEEILKHYYTGVEVR